MLRYIFAYPKSGLMRTEVTVTMTPRTRSAASLVKMSLMSFCICFATLLCLVDSILFRYYLFRNDRGILRTGCSGRLGFPDNRGRLLFRYLSYTGRLLRFLHLLQLLLRTLGLPFGDDACIPGRRQGGMRLVAQTVKNPSDRLMLSSGERTGLPA